MTRATYKKLIFLVLVLITSLIFFAKTPPVMNSSEISWSPKSAADNGQLLLTRGWPKSIEITTSCNQILRFKQGVFLDMGGLVMSVSDSKLIVESPIPAKFSHSANLPNEKCDLVVAFSSKSGNLTIKIDDDQEIHHLDVANFPHVHKLVVAPSSEPVIDFLKIVTRPTGIEKQGERLFYFYIVLVALITLILLIAINDKRNFRIGIRRFRHSMPVDSFVFIGLLIGSFLIPTFVDDGWVWQRIVDYSGRGVFGTYYENFDAWLPQGFLHEFLLYQLYSWGFSFYWIKFVIVLVLTLCWILLRNLILAPFFSSSHVVMWPAAAMWVSFSSVWLISLRAEPWVVTCSCLSLIFLVRYLADGRNISLLTCLTFSGIALTLHQTGWTAMGPAVIAVFEGWRRSRENRQMSFYLTTLVIAVSISILLLLFPMDLSSLRENIQEFSTTSHSEGGVFFEWKRYFNLISDGTTSAARKFSVLSLFLCLFLSALYIKRLSLIVNAIWSSSVLSVLLLALTSSKWTWHFGALAVPSLIFIGIVCSTLEKGRQRIPTLFLVTLLVIGAGSAISLPHHWGYYDYYEKSWANFSVTYGPSSLQSFWILGIIITIALLLLNVRWHAHIRSMTLVTVLLLPLTLSYVWIVNDTPNLDIWSHLNQNLAQAKGQVNCGALEDTELIEQPIPLSVADSENSFEGRLVEGAYPSIPALMGTPNPNLSTWGSWFVPNLPSDEEVEPFVSSNFNYGSFTSPTYKIGQNTRLGIWSATGDAANTSATLVFLDAKLTSISESLVTFSSLSGWSLTKFKVPKNSYYLKVVMQDNSKNTGGWGVVTSPFSFTSESVNKKQASSTFFIGPFVRLRYPCVQLPDLEQGYWPRVDYLIRDATQFGFNKFQSDTMFDVGCSSLSDACVTKIEYKIANIQIEKLTGE